MPPKMTGSPTNKGKPMTIAQKQQLSRQREAPPPPPRELTPEEKAAEEEEARKKAEAKKAAYQAWLAANDAPPEDDGIVITDEGIFRTAEFKRDLEDGPDPPLGRDSMVNHWLSDKFTTPDLATDAARKSVRVRCENGIIQPSVGWDAKGAFHPVRHFHAGSAYERYRRGLPPGYTGYIPQDATPVVGAKIGVIEKAHPILYSKVRPATGSVVADLLDDKIVTSTGVGEFYVAQGPTKAGF